MNIDLHFHSNYSDGIYSPKELLLKANDNDANILALTDHDTIEGLDEAFLEIKKYPRLKLITGVEISCLWNKKSIHLIALNFDRENIKLNGAIDQNRQCRLVRLKKIAEQLEKVNIFGAYEGSILLASNPQNVGRAHVARYLLNKGYVNSFQKAFDKWLGNGKIADVQNEWVTLEEIVPIINDANGIAVIAHPARYDFSDNVLNNLCKDFVKYGGKAIEISSYSQSVDERLKLTLLANKYGLFASLGSDYHGDEVSGHRILGRTPSLPALCKPIWTLF